MPRGIRAPVPRIWPAMARVAVNAAPTADPAERRLIATIRMCQRLPLSNIGAKAEEIKGEGTVRRSRLRFPWRIFFLVILAGTQASAGPNEDILAASKAGDRARVEAALTYGASVNAVDEKGLSPPGLMGLTPLGLAAAYGH